jgi:type IV secretory pathway VirD2 relaxase
MTSNERNGETNITRKKKNRDDHKWAMPVHISLRVVGKTNQGKQSGAVETLKERSRRKEIRNRGLMKAGAKQTNRQGRWSLKRGKRRNEQEGGKGKS